MDCGELIQGTNLEFSLLFSRLLQLLRSFLSSHMPVSSSYHGSSTNTSCDKGSRHFDCIHWMGCYAMIDVEVGGKGGKSK